MPKPDAVSDTAPTEPLERIPLESIQRLLQLPPEKTMKLTGRDAELLAQLTESRLKICAANPHWTDQQIDNYLFAQFREEPRT